MSYSRRQLYALGEPLGDCVTRKTGGKIIYGDGGGGGGQPSQTTQTTDLPEWARGYAKDTLAKGAALTDISKNPYQPYKGERIAGFQPLQEQAFKSAATLDAGPAGFQAGIGQYMSPYMQNVVDIEKREAARQSGILGTQQQAQAAQAGAFGGGRDAIMRAERERNLSQQMGDIQAKGSQAAYEQAANQFRQGIQQQGALTQLQTALGQQQQQQAQRPLDVAYQDFLNQQNYPYKQLGFMSDMIRGLPLGQRSTSQVYEAPGSVLGQLGGLGMGAYGLSKLFADGGLATGDLISESEPVIRYADGGVTSPQNVENILSKLSDQQLIRAKEAALNRRDVQEAQMIDAEMAERASIRSGLGGAFNQLPVRQQEEMMAGGGIVAFADGDMVVDPMGTGASEIYEAPVNPNSLSFIQRITNEPAWKAKAPSDVVPAKSAAGAGRGSYQGYKAQEDVKKSAPVPAPAPKRKKLSPTIDKAITKMAEDQGVPKEDFMAMYDKVHAKLQAESKEDLKGLQELIDKQSGKSKEIKEKALGKALAEFGFNMAAQASKTGRESKGQGLAGLLGSASAAAPVLSASMAESEKLAAAADENDIKMQIEMRKYNIAARKNDSATAMSAAQNMRILQQQQETIKQQQRQLDETIRANKAREGILSQQVAAKSGTAGLRSMQGVARSRAEAIKLAQNEVNAKIKGSMGIVKPEDYDRMLKEAMKKYLPITTGFGMTGVSSSKDDDDIIDLD